MNIINSSNPRGSLLQSMGPFRMASSATPHIASVLPERWVGTGTSVYGKTTLYGKQVVPNKARSGVMGSNTR